MYYIEGELFVEAINRLKKKRPQLGNICKAEDRSFAREEANTSVEAKHTVKAAISIVFETRPGQRINVVLPTGHPICQFAPLVRVGLILADQSTGTE